MREVCVDYVSRVQSLKAILPKTSLDEVFNSLDEFRKDFDSIRSQLRKVLGLKNWQVDMSDPFDHGDSLAFAKAIVDDRNFSNQYIISTIVPVINNNMKYIIDFMDKNGYYFIRCYLGEDYIKLDEPNLGSACMANLCFAKKWPADISPYVRQYPYLYHAIPEKMMPSVRKYGLIPHARICDINILNSEIHYPERTYFFYGMSGFEAVRYAKDNMLPGKYRLLRVNVSDIAQGTKIYCDPLVGGKAIYVEFEIPYDYISEEASFDIS